MSSISLMFLISIMMSIPNVAESYFFETSNRRPQLPEGRFVIIPVRVKGKCYNGRSFDRIYNYLRIYRRPVNIRNYKNPGSGVLAATTFDADVSDRIIALCNEHPTGLNNFRYFPGDPTMISERDPRNR